ncbi:MAG: SGNH/GDSL hydrolase family protein [Anaerolineae bacterium]|nr:SGNH/GDSL hydrolase family protein [Anaerolineae bacterium]
MTIPILPAPGSIGDHARQIFTRGQARHNNPHAFVKIGDCNTDSPYFLAPFDLDDYDLGRYAGLQPTIDFFAGWFAYGSQVGHVGNSITTLLDPFFTNPEHCPSAQPTTPLACEYGYARPGVAVMMFGANEVLGLSETEFAGALTQVVEQSLAEGIIPVLTTFSWPHDAVWNKAMAFNLITVEIAQRYDIPLINFWRAAQALPSYGLTPDDPYLSKSGPTTTIIFNGAEAVSGHTLRNLLTLQMLDMLRTEVLAAAP